MPFVPLTPDEQEQAKPPCTDREHYPPTQMVIRQAMKWRCPSCGKETIVWPAAVVTMSKGGEESRSYIRQRAEGE